MNKNGYRGEKQNYKCVTCGRQFIENPQKQRGYSDEVRSECLKMYVNGMGFRGIEWVKGVHHTTIIHWVKQSGKELPDALAPESVPEVGELDELQTFVGLKKQDLALDSRKPFPARCAGLGRGRLQC
ncbi:MAG: IS1 family transposase [Spirulina sp. SIO3F2]|nr:IS1 family transposase [Spirulina sp. SIO3F2]